MYHVILEGHTYSYDVYEMLTLYFHGEKINVCENEEDLPGKCKLIRSSIKVYDTQIQADCIMFDVNNGAFQEKGHKSIICPMEDSLKKSTKHAVKLSVFLLLKDITGKEMPWGILVGIRPSKIVNDLKDRDFSEASIYDVLKSKYLIRDDKIKLVMGVSQNSYSVINRNRKKISVYIGIPFCPTRCIYCSFASNPISRYANYVDAYVDSLKYEINRLCSFIKDNFYVENVYIGGGTPTSLPDETFKDFLKSVGNCFDIESIREFTVEAGRPDTINDYKLRVMKEMGVGRISINPQSMNDSTLKRIGRNHDVQDIIDKYKMAREMGFDNINMDVIVGLPGENLEHVRKTVSSIIGLSPENITVHTMAVKRASRLREKLIEDDHIPIPDSMNVELMMDYVQSEMTGAGYLPYYMYRQKMMVGNLENVGYCIRDFECIYNIQMIEEKETIVGMGADGVTKLVFHDENRIERFANKKDVNEYIKTIEENTDKKILFLNMLT